MEHFLQRGPGRDRYMANGKDVYYIIHPWTDQHLKVYMAEGS